MMMNDALEFSCQSKFASRSVNITTMSSEDQLIPIPRADWPELRDKYKVDWPKHEVPFNTIQNYLNWVEIDSCIKDLQVFSLNDTWRENGTYVIVDRYQVYAYTLEQSCESLKRALLLLDWDYNHLVCCLSKSHRPALDEVINQFKLETKWDHDSFLFWMSKEEAMQFEIALPPGLHLRKLGAEDGVYANKIWPHRLAGSEYFIKRLAVWNVSVGLFNESNDLLAWSFHWPTGCIGPLEVHPDHYKKGYGTIITKAIAKEVAKIGLNCYGTVVITNEASKAMFSKLGFSVADNQYFVHTRGRKLSEWSD